uniref:Reverse transcriptase RNase H-like domain-containing protein n=1 Tax=Lactuca sativa TaxID=4236 RepID=A0A9R1WDI9_LACSA|nr:hypothetical protein LSAT_V11C200100950 [Lactuca sativa]
MYQGVQKINGRFTAFGRFITKSTKKAILLFHTIKGCVDKNQLKWMAETDKPLQHLKEALKQLSAMARPYQERPVNVPSSIWRGYIRDKKQLSIHLVSRALQDLELNYPILEKLVLALIYASRFLRCYFHAHNIEVLTNFLVKEILLSPKKPGRLEKWHDIDYRPHTNIKDQALVDFLVKIPDTLKGVPTVVSIDPSDPGASKDVWELHTNGVVSKEGSVLKNPNSEEIIYALRFEFQVSNKKVEYKALLTEVGGKYLSAFSDSLLITNQVNGTYESKHHRIQRYMDTT